MRKVSVPVDMSSEQKVILGVLSIRQLIYVAIAGATIYAYIPLVFSLTAGIQIAIRIVICLIGSLPVLLLLAPLAFLKKRNYHMFFDYYLLIKFRAKSQYGKWRKGNKAKKWMEEL